LYSLRTTARPPTKAPAHIGKHRARAGYSPDKPGAKKIVMWGPAGRATTLTASPHHLASFRKLLSKLPLAKSAR